MIQISLLKKIILPLSILGLVSCSSSPDNENVAKEVIINPKVKIEAAQEEKVILVENFTATVEPNIKNNIAPQTPIRIDKILVEVGDRVKKNQTLAQMNADNLVQQETQLRNLRLEYKRVETLYKIGGASQSEYDTKRTALEMAETMFKNLSENTKLISPISGIVTARNYDNEDLYSGQLPVLVVEQIRPVKLYVNVSESFFTEVKKGMNVDVRLDVYKDELFKGKVSLIYPVINSSTRTFLVEVLIDNKDERVRPGMFARVSMNLGERISIVISDRAIIKQSGSADRFVYVYKDGKVIYTKVELGRLVGDRYELLSGVENQEQVVIVGQARLKDGLAVDVIK